MSVHQFNGDYESNEPRKVCFCCGKLITYPYVMWIAEWHSKKDSNPPCIYWHSDCAQKWIPKFVSDVSTACLFKKIRNEKRKPIPVKI